MKIKCLLIFLLLSIYGCALSADETKNVEQPALLVNPSTESIQELQKLTATLFAKKHILLADNAFTKNSELAIERFPHKSKEGHLIMGRVLEAPLILQLIKKDGVCFLKNKLSGSMLPFTTGQCVIKYFQSRGLEASFKNSIRNN